MTADQRSYAAEALTSPMERAGAPEKVSTHRQRLELDLGSRTYSKDFSRLAVPDRVRQARRDTALPVYGNLPPA